jgi:integrase/recombinase XerD
MFEQIFQREKALRRQSQTPLCAERRQYLQHLQSQGASRSTLKHHATYLLPVISLLCQKWPAKVTERRIQAAADRWANRRPVIAKGRAAGRRNFVFVARAWFRFFDGLDDEVCIPYVQQLEEFVQYMRVERNLSPVTIHTRRGLIEGLMRWIHTKKRALPEVDARTIDRFLADKARRDGLQRVSIHNYAFGLRSFLTYAEQRGWCQQGTAASVDPPRVYRETTLPAGPSWDCVRQMLKQLRGREPKEIRDRAIILLFALYGFRTSEVSRLSLDDIDWKAGRILLHRSKQRDSSQVYPLVHSVRDALASYITHVRPRSERREIFLQLCMPYQPLGSGAFWQIVRKRLRPVARELQHHGPHALRHACATRLLQQGLQMKGIGDFLGHRSPRSTAIYAKVDFTSLRCVADFDLGRFI